MYTQHVSATVTITGNITDFLNNVNDIQSRFIAAVAQAAGGVPVANVVIVSVTPHQGQAPGTRRLLSTSYTVSAVVKGGSALRDLKKHLARHVGDVLTKGSWSTT